MATRGSRLKGNFALEISLLGRSERNVERDLGAGAIDDHGDRVAPLVLPEGAVEILEVHNGAIADTDDPIASLQASLRRR